MNKIAIKLTNINKSYEIHHEKPTLVEKFVKGRNETFVALRNISIVINKGEKIGIIGPNGSGKTTLLKILSGITTPTKGNVNIRGRAISLIDLEAGFHPDLTGRQNLFLNGMLLGMNKSEIKTKFVDIVDFAGIGKFIDAQLFTYSEGMKLRLGFSIAINSNPDILLMDENFIVADQEFRNKSFNTIKKYIKQGKTMVIASHYLDFLKDTCDRIIYLNNGEIVDSGKPLRIIRRYEKDINKK